MALAFVVALAALTRTLSPVVATVIVVQLLLATAPSPTDADGRPIPTPQFGATLAGGKMFVTKTIARGGTNTTVDVELVVDPTPSIGNTATADFHSYNSGMGLGNDMPHSGHMEKTKPAGGNILFLDGHAAWRKFRNLGPWYETNDRSVYIWY